MFKSSSSQLIFFAGVVLLLNGLFHVFVESAIRKRNLRLVGDVSGSRVSLAVSAETMSFVRLPRRFLELFFSALSVFFSVSMATTQLGLAVCFGLFCYFVLEYYAAIKVAKSRNRSAISVASILILIPAACYAMAIVLTLITKGVLG